MPDEFFCTWLAETLTILEYIPEITPLKQRFIDVGRSHNSIADKVKEVRGILLSVVKRINSPLFGTGMMTASPQPNTSGIVFAPTITQNLTQSIDVTLDTLLKRVNETEGVTDDRKEQAKPLVTKIWEYVRSGAKDSAALIDLATKMAMLSTLGFDIQQLLSGLL